MNAIAEALASVSKSEQELVAMFYGFDGRSCTREEVARLCRQSLSQVDQTTRSVMRRMRHPTCAKLIRETLASADESIWAALAGEHDIVSRAESTVEAGARLPGELRFAIECQYGTLESWLSANARATTRAWYRSRFSESEIDALILKLAPGTDEIRLPWPLESLARAIEAETEAVETAVRLSGDFRMYAGYVAGMPLGTHQPRAIRLHRILSGNHAGQLIRGQPLAEEYRSGFADDACTRKDAEIAMASYPHLFLRVADLGWCGVGRSGSRATAAEGSSEDEVTFHRWSEDRKSQADVAARDAIRQILEEHGPLRIPQIQRLIRKRPIEILPSSVLMYVTMGDEFVRLAPGVYGPAEHRAAGASSAKLLLRRSACLQYVYTRWAGEPPDAYPLWTPEMEAEWCEWVQWRDKNLLASLLAVADPSGWPVDDSYRETWLWKKECLGHFRLEKPPRYPLEAFPLNDLLALVKAARWRGAANWLLANRVRGRPRLLDRGAASPMALLIGVGAVVPAAHWQRTHVVSSDAGEIDSLLSEELHRRGALEWNGASGRAVLERVANTIDRGETGWVAPAELRRLCERLRGQP
ncbi:hypothetical protein SBA4_4370007 [Candidatus Sulfopaludibacter sp. SbA4]|nr:hypothetical protein SBA4_4370007 [Candidatus Sulfopaludibacter sp. SbA4]